MFRLKIVKVDCDSHKDLMKHYRARGLPLLVIFSDGKVNCAAKDTAAENTGK